MRIIFVAYISALVVMGILDGIWFSLSIGKINAIHSRITGSLSDGTPYQANDTGALA